MMSGSDYEREVGKAFLQLDLYLKALQLPVTVKDLYQRAYKNRLGEYYDDQWLDLLEYDSEIQACLDEPFTVQSIIETLVEYDHKPVLFALVRFAHQLNIGFSHRFVIGIAQD